MLVTPININVGIGNTGAIERPGQSIGAPEGPGFADVLGKIVSNVEETAVNANTAVMNMLNQTGDVHTAMIALHEAEEAVQLTVAIRNKFVQAYQDIMRMAL